MSRSTLSTKSSIFKLITDPSYTASQLLAHPLTAAHAPIFQTRRDEGMVVLTQEIQHKETCATAQARVDRAAVKLDVVASKVSKEILIITENSLTAGLYTSYFGAKPLGAFCKPKLGKQKTKMATWGDLLESSTYPTLVALAPEVRAAVDEVDAAIKARDNAQAQLRYFRDFGERRQWVDRTNGSRKEVYGLLSKLPHEHPTLPADFADQFFRSPTARDDGDEQEEPETAEELQAVRAELQERLAAVDAQLAEVAAKERAAKQAAEARARKAAKLAEVRKASAALAEEEAALAAELEADEA